MADWIDLKNYLGDEYEGWYGKTGRQQRLAFIWRKDAVELSDIGELKGVERKSVPGVSAKTFPRRPLTAYVKSQKGGLDFRIITVHLYWSVDKARYAEAKKLNEWAANYLNGQNDKDLIIIGDCNTKPMGSDETHNSQTINNFEKNGILTAVSKEHHEYTTPESEERYDHAFLSSRLLNEYVEGSWDVRRELVSVYPTLYLRDISNHVPVSLTLNDVDNDTVASGGFGE